MYIEPRAKVLRHLDRIVAWRRGEKPAPVTIEWDLSNACTLGCQDCHFAYTHVRGPWATRARTFPVNQDKSGGFADLPLVLRALVEAREAGVQSIVWAGGGEPTTHPAWPLIIDRAAELGYEQGMYTHGGLFGKSSLGRHMAPTLAQRLATRATWVVVSLDACDHATYAREKGVTPFHFHEACEGVVSLSGHTAIVGVSYLLHEDNWTRAREMVAWTRGLGAHYTTFRPTIQFDPANPAELLGDRSWVTAALPLLGELSRERDVEVDLARFQAFRDWTTHPYPACYGIRLSTTVTPDGRVWVCGNRREFEGSCLGDLRLESFGAIWSRHPGVWTDFTNCRAACRLYQVNETLAALEQRRPHEAFL